MLSNEIKRVSRQRQYDTVWPMLNCHVNFTDCTYTHTDTPKKHGCLLAAVIAIITIVIIVCIMAGMIFLALKFTLYTDTDCQNVTPTIGAYSRSGSYSLLDAISYEDLTMICYVPLLYVSLNNRDSTLEIYQMLCQNIESQYFQVNYEFNDLPSNDGPRPVFDENFSPHNYFMDGIIQVEIINATSTLSSVNINLCLFFNTYEYDRFLRAELNWNSYTKNANCHTIVAKSGDNCMASFNISKPTFAFLGMATADNVQVSRLNITAIGREISNLGKNSTKVCQLNGEDMICSFNLLNNQNQSICIVAYEEGNPDGTYDYSNLTISLPNQVKHDNPYKLTLTVYGSVSLGVIMISVALLLIGVIILCKRIHKRRRTPRSCSIQSDQVTHDPVREDNITQHHIHSKERPLKSFYGSNQLQQTMYQQDTDHLRSPDMVPEQQSPGEETRINQKAGLHRSHRPVLDPPNPREQNSTSASQP